MDANANIRPVTWDEPLKKGEIALTDKEAAELQPMNRAERRRWQRENKHRKIG